MPYNPILIENIRDNNIESVHRGTFALIDSNSKVQWAVGNYNNAIFPRSSLKPFQTLTALEGGIINNFALTMQEIAILSSSHNGTCEHAHMVSELLQKAGIADNMLQCGEAFPKFHHDILGHNDAYNIPSSIRHQCSGNHACLMMLALSLGYDANNYHQLSHPVQQRIMGVLEAMCATTLKNDDSAIDGCSIPTWRIPLINFAYAYACFGSGDMISDKRYEYCRTIMEATWQYPTMIAGHNRHCTTIATQLAPHVFAKVGAEGVYGACFPAYGLGLVIKIDDGSIKAAEVVLNYIMDKIGILDDASITDKASWINPSITNNAGVETGFYRVANF